MSQNITLSDAGEPFVKWAGGKQWLAETLRILFSNVKGKFYEPFVGGGAAFFALSPQRAVLSDINEPLIETYRAVRDTPDQVLKELENFEVTEDCYYRVRSSKPESRVARAARFIFLNRTCWNGLYRVNRAGNFNVPMGRFNHNPAFRKPTVVRSASETLQGKSLFAADFEKAVSPATDRDSVYFDPPYITKHTNNGFRRYNESLFSWSDQERLAEIAGQLAAKGCRVVVSNADYPPLVELYDTFSAWRLKRRSALAGRKRSRGTVTEILLLSPTIVEETKLRHLRQVAEPCGRMKHDV